MKITVKVDQAKCLRDGIDAPASTTVLELDPPKKMVTTLRPRDGGGRC